MTGHLAGAYAPGASCRVGARTSEGGLDQQGVTLDGLSFRASRRRLPAPRASNSLDRQTSPRRGGVQHLPPPFAWYHLPPLHDTYLRDRLHAGYRPYWFRLVLGDPRRSARHQPLDGQLHPARSDPRGTVNWVARWEIPGLGGESNTVTRRTIYGGAR